MSIFNFGCKKVAAVSFIMIGSCVPIWANAQQTEVFSWNADSETYIVNGQPSTCLSMKGGTVIDTTEKHSGSGSLKHTLTDAQGDRGCDAGAMAFGGDIFDGGETYFRWWMKIHPDMNWGSDQRKAKFARLTRTNEKNPAYTTMYLVHNSFRWAGAFNPTGRNNNINLFVDFKPSDGTCLSSKLIGNLGASCTEWREYIFYFKRNTCPTCMNGVAKLFVNGQLADEATNVTFAEYVPSDGVSTFKYAWAGVGGLIYPQMCANGSVCGTGGTIWIDDISIDTKWNSMQFSEDQPLRPMPPQLSAN